VDYRRTYRSAVVSFADLVSRLPADRWEAHALGEWSLRELVGHTVGSGLRQVPVILGTSAAAATLHSPQEYWTFARSAPPELVAAAVAASATDAGETGRWLGAEATARVSELAGQATAALAAARDDDVVATAAGGMLVRDWVPTRTFELVVHGLDIATAAGVPFEVGQDAMAEVVTMAAQIAAAAGDGPQVLRALTGRAPLPEGFSVL
jgi:hypothetical protein